MTLLLILNITSTVFVDANGLRAKGIMFYRTTSLEKFRKSQRVIPCTKKVTVLVCIILNVASRGHDLARQLFVVLLLCSRFVKVKFGNIWLFLNVWC